MSHSIGYTCHHQSIPHFLHPLFHSVRVAAHLRIPHPKHTDHNILYQPHHSLQACLFLSVFLLLSLFSHLLLSLPRSYSSRHWLVSLPFFIIIYRAAWLVQLYMFSEIISNCFSLGYKPRQIIMSPVPWCKMSTQQTHVFCGQCCVVMLSVGPRQLFFCTQRVIIKHISLNNFFFFVMDIFWVSYNWRVFSESSVSDTGWCSRHFENCNYFKTIKSCPIFTTVILANLPKSLS